MKTKKNFFFFSIMKVKLVFFLETSCVKKKKDFKSISNKNKFTLNITIIEVHCRFVFNEKKKGSIKVIYHFFFFFIFILFYLFILFFLMFHFLILKHSFFLMFFLDLFYY
jgi:hypothetical protein